MPWLARGQAPGTLNAALIGCGGRGAGAAADFLEACKRAGIEGRIVALADLFSEPVTRATGQFHVPAEATFVGFDAYLRAVQHPGVHCALIASPSGFHPIHLDACIEAAKHVFVEKSAGCDGPGIRKVLAAGESATRNGLSIVAGTQRRHQAGYIETVQRIQDGAIGDIVSLSAKWLNGGPIWNRGWNRAVSDMENHVRNWPHFAWLAGEFYLVDQNLHNIDVCNWVMNDHPIKVVGDGFFKATRDASDGDMYDLFVLTFTYRNGIEMEAVCGTNKFPQSTLVTGTDGQTTPLETLVLKKDLAASTVMESVKGAKGSGTPSGRLTLSDGTTWRTAFRSGGITPYVQEHLDLVNSIRTGKPINEARDLAESTLTAIMGREAAYSGQEITWDMVLNSEMNRMPSEFKFGPLPSVKAANAREYRLY
jgi:predicted dehydrogenase